MIRALLLVMVMAFVNFAGAQQYMVNGAPSDLHLTHTVAAKETWFSIGKIYNLSARQIATYNKLNTENTLEIGQQLKIPLVAANFTQNDAKGADEHLVPVYHVVQDKEWMYRISVNHNKVPIENLEKWNGITRDDAKAGMKLIVGHLKVKQDGQSQPVARTSAPPAQSTPAPATTSTPATTATTASNTGGAQSSGFFRTSYANGNKTQSGVAGIFKSTSGWNDGKYYALMNNVTVGTIVKITYPHTNKVVFAKVLGELPDMKESAGLALRISDAAASQLGAVSSKFSVEITY